MEFDFVDEVLDVAAVTAAHVDEPVVREAFLCRPIAQNRSVTKLQSHLHLLSSSQHHHHRLDSANIVALVSRKASSNCKTSRSTWTSFIHVFSRLLTDTVGVALVINFIIIIINLSFVMCCVNRKNIM